MRMHEQLRSTIIERESGKGKGEEGREREKVRKKKRDMEVLERGLK